MLFDLVVLGTDPAGVSAVELAANLGHRVAIVEDPENFGQFKAIGLNRKPNSAVRHFCGSARFATAEALEIRRSQQTQVISARHFLLACGNRPKRPAHVPFDGKRIFDSDEVTRQAQLPPSLLIVGAGQHGLRCAADLLERDVRISLVDLSKTLDPARESLGTQILWERIQQASCPVHWGTTVLGVENRKSVATVFYDNGSIESYGGVVFAVGRVGCTQQLNLPRPDLLLDETFRVWCDETGQTGLPRFYAVGSVVGFPRFEGSPAEEAEHIIRQMFGEAISLKPPAFFRMEKQLSR